MKVTVENIKGLNKDLKVLIDKETMNSYMDEKYEEIKGTVNLKGFRPGKVPKEVLKTPVNQIGDYKFEVGEMARDIAESYENLVRA